MLKRDLEKEQKTSNKRTEYIKIIEDLEKTKGDYLNSSSIEETSKKGLMLLNLSKRFSEIDRELLNLSKDSKQDLGDHLIEVMQLELKRQKFKEEIVACKKTQRQIVKMST